MEEPQLPLLNSINPRLKVLLRNFVLSDDIAFRFSNTTGANGPSLPTICHWVNKLASKSELINVFLDYEPSVSITGRKRYLRLPCPYAGAILKKTPFKFMTPTEVADYLQPVSAINIPSPISWPTRKGILQHGAQ